MNSCNKGAGKNILHSLFFDSFNHGDTLVEKHEKRIRPMVLAERNRFRHCVENVRGFQVFVCEGGHDMKKVPFRCKGNDAGKKLARTHGVNTSRRTLRMSSRGHS